VERRVERRRRREEAGSGRRGTEVKKKFVSSIVSHGQKVDLLIRAL